MTKLASMVMDNGSHHAAPRWQARTTGHRLGWQVIAETRTSYRVFVHLLAEDGSLITQSDAVPDHWTRPTTGWVAGEYIRDRHTLTLPADVSPGTYKLVVGLYETATGSRLGESETGSLTVVGKP